MNRRNHRDQVGGLVLSLLNEGSHVAALLNASGAVIPPDLHDTLYLFFDGEDVTLDPNEGPDDYTAWYRGRSHVSLFECIKSRAGRLAGEIDYLVPEHMSAQEVEATATALLEGLRLLRKVLTGEATWPEWERFANKAPHVARLGGLPA